MGDEMEFIYDGVIGFLTSPIWQIPIDDFIDKKSVGELVEMSLFPIRILLVSCYCWQMLTTFLTRN